MARRAVPDLKVVMARARAVSPLPAYRESTCCPSARSSLQQACHRELQPPGKLQIHHMITGINGTHKFSDL